MHLFIQVRPIIEAIFMMAPPTSKKPTENDTDWVLVHEYDSDEEYIDTASRSESEHDPVPSPADSAVLVTETEDCAQSHLKQPRPPPENSHETTKEGDSSQCRPVGTSAPKGSLRLSWERRMAGDRSVDPITEMTMLAEALDEVSKTRTRRKEQRKSKADHEEGGGHGQLEETNLEDVD